MMVALPLYGYSRGLHSSRQLARAIEERVDVMAVTGLNRPDFRTIADFRRRHLEAICKRWTTEPDRFTLNPLQQMSGPNI